MEKWENPEHLFPTVSDRVWRRGSAFFQLQKRSHLAKKCQSREKIIIKEDERSSSTSLSVDEDFAAPAYVAEYWSNMCSIGESFLASVENAD